MLDLDKARGERAAARQSDAARHEARGETLPVVFGGVTICELPSELPIDVLNPLRVVSEDIALLLRWGLKIAEQGGQVDAQREGVGLFLDLLSGNEKLPDDLINVATGIARRLLGDEGYQAFIGRRPSREDVFALARGVIDWYGVGLGESLRSTDSSTSDGPTSRETSPTTSPVSTPEASGLPPALTAS